MPSLSRHGKLLLCDCTEDGAFVINLVCQECKHKYKQKHADAAKEAPALPTKGAGKGATSASSARSSVEEEEEESEGAATTLSKGDKVVIRKDGMLVGGKVVEVTQAGVDVAVMTKVRLSSTEGIISKKDKDYKLWKKKSDSSFDFKEPVSFESFAKLPQSAFTGDGKELIMFSGNRAGRRQTVSSDTRRFVKDGTTGMHRIDPSTLRFTRSVRIMSCRVVSCCSFLFLQLYRSLYVSIPLSVK